jgi:hypothetical protein
MAGVANFGGKKAAPFVKGGKRRKKVMLAKSTLRKAKGADLSNLSTKARNNLKPSAFVFPKTREFPIHDRAHAIAALRLSGRVDPAKAKVVRAAVRKRYPDIGKG